jgi:hypothetical protein
VLERAPRDEQIEVALCGPRAELGAHDAIAFDDGAG